MPFTVQDLIEDKPNPITVNRTDTAQTALERMIEGDFSQLPVVAEDNKVEGIVTSDSIIRALKHFDLTIKEMHVVNAVQSVNTFTSEDDLFELLDYLKDSYAVVVVDNNGRITGIVTNYDTTEYFRRRGEDIMLVEDIESMLKEYILVCFQSENGETDESALENAIDEITPSDAKFRKDFKKALNNCSDVEGIDKNKLDRAKIEEIFTEHLSPKQPPKPFDRLTLNEYIELFLSKKRWNQYKEIFKLDPVSCRKLLDPIREIRNALAHFRADLTSEQREQLRFCKDWLTRHQQEITEVFSPTIEEVISESKTNSAIEPILNSILLKNNRVLTAAFSGMNWSEVIKSLYPQLIEQSTPNESKYADLATYLQSLPLEENTIQLNFADIESLIINAELPKTARQHRSWWANDSVGHVQSRQWVEVGWRVSSVNISQERVTFSRIKDREKAYIKFFSDLLADLRLREDFNAKELSPTGRSYITLDTLASNDNSPMTFIGCSFARNKRFRVELYIDTGTDELNETIFENLYTQKENIEALIESPLEWEKLDHRRASRIAAYHAGSITDTREFLSLLRKWAVRTIEQFYKVFHVELKDKITVQNNDVNEE
jgi:CBS domain-containing protein